MHEAAQCRMAPGLSFFVAYLMKKGGKSPLQRLTDGSCDTEADHEE